MAGGNVIRLIPLQPYSFKQSLWFLDRNLDDCMHQVFPESVRRVISNGDQHVLIEIKSCQNILEVNLLKGDLDQETITAFVTAWLDLDRDLKPFYQKLEKDKELCYMRDQYRGFKIVGIPDLFECLVWCISGQQINLDFAYTLKRRLVEKYGHKINFMGESYYGFPEPELLADLNIEALRSLQFTNRKSEYILTIARAFAEKRLSSELVKMQGTEEKMQEFLLSFKGIGPWSANYALMKSLRCMDRLPYGDAGLRQALLKHKGVNARSNQDFDQALGAFKGWRTYLVFYLWRSLREMA